MRIPGYGLPLFFFRFSIIMSLLFAFGCGEEKVVEDKDDSRPVKYWKIHSSGFDSTVEYSGKISAAQEVSISFEVSGKINTFPVKEGERVKKGAVLARLDDRDFRTAFDSSKANLNAARADYQRARELYENNTISKRDLDVARRNFEVAQADLRAAQKSLDDTRLVAPFAGVVARTLVENHQSVQAKQSVLVLQDDSSLEMVVDIPEQDYAGVDKNLSFADATRIFKPEIQVSAVSDQRFPATLKEASSAADEITRTFELTLGFEPPPGISILPGMTARLFITGEMPEESESIRIPAGAVFSTDQKQPGVWLINTATNTVEQHIIEIGEMSGDKIEVKSGLKSGDIIAASGIHQLREGMSVRQYEKP